MVLYGPNFRLMFLNHLFLYEGVYSTIRIVQSSEPSSWTALAKYIYK